MYKIKDLQFPEGRYFGGGEGIKFKTKKEIIEQLASYHNIDYSGVKDNDEPYKDIFEFLNTLKTNERKLNWLLEYGQWEIIEINNKTDEELLNDETMKELTGYTDKEYTKVIEKNLKRR